MTTSSPAAAIESKKTRAHGDYGADLVLEKDGVRTVVQAKRWTKNVGVKAIQEAVAAKPIYRCEHAMVVTNRYFTEQARRLAKANGVRLWNRDELVRAAPRQCRRRPLSGPAVGRELPVLTGLRSPNPLSRLLVEIDDDNLDA